MKTSPYNFIVKSDKQILAIANAPIASFERVSLGLDYGKGIVVLFDRDCHPALIGYCLYWVYPCAWTGMGWQGENQAIVVKSGITGFQSGQVISTL